MITLLSKSDCYSEDRIFDLYEAVLDRINQTICQDLLKESPHLKFNAANDICASKQVLLIGLKSKCQPDLRFSVSPCFKCFFLDSNNSCKKEFCSSWKFDRLFKCAIITS